MMLTEELAREKWCPFARAVGFLSDGEGLVDTTSNRHPDPTIMEQVRCLGSGCMAWRWDDAQQNAFQEERPEGEGWERVGKFWSRRPTAGDAWRPGYCGLAGCPD